MCARNYSLRRTLHVDAKILGVLSANRNVWSAAPSQAKSERDMLVCANVYGLCWS